MAASTELKTYSDIRKLINPKAFTLAMSYISWHNRLINTHMLLPWEALVVGFALEKRALDGLLYPAIKSFLDDTREQQPQSIDDCRARADALLRRLYPEETPH